MRLTRMLRNRLALLVMALAAIATRSRTLPAAPPAAATLQAMAHPDAAHEAFFESKIRPLLATRCLSCHGEKDPEGGVRLDSAAALLGSDASKPLVQPGHPETSRLIKVIGYADEIKMPPDAKLPDVESQLLHEWIRRGAPFPANSRPAVVPPTSSEGIAKAKQSHWSLRPVVAHAPPAVKNEAWTRSAIDRFVLAQLEANGLAPSPAADRRTLLRRLSFDLIGLPPTYAEVQAFENDRAPNAIETVIDRLLASPRYGERWARHWLDVARYSDTKGYVFTEERRYPFSYTYRDYVIAALNKDLRFDRFILEQLAADQLDLGDDRSPLAAMGFLTVGRRFSNNANDIIDDRIDVVSRGLLGLSVTCARCHDHKYDPIPTEDYYALYGVFASSFEPGDLPQLGTATASEAFRKFEADMKRLEQSRDEYQAQQGKEVEEQSRKRIAEYLASAWEIRGKDIDVRKSRDSVKPHPLLVKRWSIYLQQMLDKPDAVFLAWREFAQLGDGEFAARSKEVVAKLKTLPTAPTATGRINAMVQKAFVNQPPKSMKEVVSKYGFLLSAAEDRWKKLGKRGSDGKPITALPQTEWEELRQTLYREGSPCVIAKEDIRRLIDREARQQLVKINNQIEKLRITSPAAPPRGMVLNDSPQAVDPVVFLRGDANRLGKKTTRHFPQAVGDFGARPFAKGSGRLELAQAIANPQNPLTARVIVNRVWMHHLGAGLVRTPSDFGVRGAPPSHPELLDYLSSRFMQNGWSLKKLHRDILLSAVYQQASEQRPAEFRKDPENRLLWRMNPTRLEFEPMRDSWLAIAGNLDLQSGGRGFDIMATSEKGRRSVYAFIDRQDLPQLFRTFDFASPDVSTGQRAQTTIPQQALFGMNSPFLVSQARALTHLIPAKNEAERVISIYRRALARDPSADELQTALNFVRGTTGGEPADDVASAWQYGYGAFDAIAKRVTGFEPLPTFADGHWGGAKLPDDKLGWVHLTAAGGHPGGDEKHAAIRRWVSPIAGDIEIRGSLGHLADNGDGVRGIIVSSRQGTLGQWSVKHGQKDASIETVAVQPGETIDFVVDRLGSQDHDSFAWAPVIKTKQAAGSPASVVQVWHARNDFSGPAPPRLDGWEQLAQALLISNEFVFVD